MRFAVVCTISAGGARRHVLTHWIEGVPEGVTVVAVTEALAGSEHAGQMSEYGVFLANRRVMTEARVPDKVTEPDTGVVSVDWASLSDTRRSVQLNARVRPADRARWASAAERAGASLSSWIEATLNAAAGAG